MFLYYILKGDYMKNKGRHLKINKKRSINFYFKTYFTLFLLILIIIIFNVLVPNLKLNSVYKSSAYLLSNIDNENTISTNSKVIESSTNVIVPENNSNIDNNLDKHTSQIDSGIKNLINNILTDDNINTENFAFFYYNIDNNKEYFYNEYTQFTAASTVKLPVAMLYYDKINQGELKETDTLLYKSGCYEYGNGLTNYTYSAGDYVPINFLLEQSIINSDNTAVNILMTHYGYEDCRKEINNKYTNQTVSDEFYDSNLTFASYSFDIINYLYNHIDNYNELIQNLKISSEGQYLKKYINNYEVAHKYGSYDGNVHDYGIVFGETTYLIGIFTKDISNADELIANISYEILNYTLSQN